MPMFEESWRGALAGLGLGVASMATPQNLEANPTVTTSAPTTNNVLADFIIAAENSKSNKSGGWSETHKKWFPYDDVGKLAIGYGHRLLPNESFKAGITDSEARVLVKRDIDVAKTRMYKELATRFKYNTTLDPDREMMLTEFVYNLGTLSKFPRLTKAILTKNWDAAKQEYKRYSVVGGVKTELKQRNIAFYDTFLKNKK